MTAADERRLVLFEVGGGAYALPIADVIEVTEWSQLAAIPTLPAAFARPAHWFVAAAAGG